MLPYARVVQQKERGVAYEHLWVVHGDLEGLHLILREGLLFYPRNEALEQALAGELTLAGEVVSFVELLIGVREVGLVGDDFI